MAVSRALGPKPGERVLDLCAAPGGKTTHLAALMRNEGEVVAVEAHAGRARALKTTAERMGATIVDVRTEDARESQPDSFDRVLVDPPCSDLGTLAARPDARWRKAGRPEALAKLQLEILTAGAMALKPGGTLVYSTCTISPTENECVVAAFLAAHEEFAASDLGAGPAHLEAFDHAAVSADVPAPRPHRRFLHRQIASPMSIRAAIAPGGLAAIGGGRS